MKLPTYLYLDRLRGVALDIMKGTHVEQTKFALQRRHAKLVHLQGQMKCTLLHEARIKFESKLLSWSVLDFVYEAICAYCVSYTYFDVPSVELQRDDTVAQIGFPPQTMWERRQVLQKIYVRAHTTVKTSMTFQRCLEYLLVLRSKILTSPLSYPAATTRSSSL